MEEACVRQRLGSIGVQDEFPKFRLLLGKRLFFFLAGEPPGNVQIGLALVAAKVEHLKGAERFTGGLQFALDLNEPLARRVNPELAEVRGDPFAAKLFRHSSRRAASAEKVRHQIAFVAAG